MKQVRVAEISGFESLALLVYEKRELDAGFLTKEPGVVHVGQSDCGKLCSFGAKRCFMLAQLRDVLTAEDSAPVTQKNNDRRTLLPERSKLYGMRVGIRQGDRRKFAAKG